MSRYTCVVCAGDFEGHGNNPAPVHDNGECCDECNRSVILPARFKLMSEHVAETDPEKDASDEVMLGSPKKSGMTKNQRKKENRRRRSKEATDVGELKVIDEDAEVLKAGPKYDWFCQMEADNSYFKFPSNEEFARFLPIDGDDKYRCGWEIASMGYLYLLCAYDPEIECAYGYVNMGNNDNSEYGAIDIEDLRKCFNRFKLTLKQLYPLTETFGNGPVSGVDLRKGPLKNSLPYI